MIGQSCPVYRSNRTSTTESEGQWQIRGGFGPQDRFRIKGPLSHRQIGCVAIFLHTSVDSTTSLTIQSVSYKTIRDF